jgi:hypothetical protein
MFESERPFYPLGQVSKFVKKYFTILFTRHSCLKFNQEVARFVILTDHITVTVNTVTFETFVLNVYRDLVAWVILIQKPRGNILTEFLRITISRSVDT